MIIASIIAFLSTLFGGLISLKYHRKLHLILGFTAGVVIGLVTLDILPEVFNLVKSHNFNPQWPMLALLVGILLFHIGEKWLLIHYGQEEQYRDHHHPSVGWLSSAALIGHSFLDGIGIGAGFQLSTSAGILIAVAVIGHDFADGINTGSLMLAHKNNRTKALMMIFADALAPILGALSTLFFHFGDQWLMLYLGFFAGTFLYIGLAEILPEAHSQDSSIKTIFLTLLGVVFIYLVTRIV